MVNVIFHAAVFLARQPSICWHICTITVHGVTVMYMKPTHIWTSMVYWKPKGKAGAGGSAQLVARVSQTGAMGTCIQVGAEQPGHEEGNRKEGMQLSSSTSETARGDHKVQEEGVLEEEAEDTYTSGRSTQQRRAREQGMQLK